MNTILNASNLTIHYGKALAVSNVSIEIQRGKIGIIVGPNGAGKTTILKVISGLISPTNGEILFESKRIVGMPAFKIAKIGLIHVPEGRRLFQNLTVLDNLRLGASVRSDSKHINTKMQEIFNSFPILKKRCEQKSGSLSGGEQQMLAIGRALMAEPKLLMLDEPCLGLAPVVIDELYSIIRNINESGVTILLVEQNVSLALKLGSYGYVLEVGSIILEGNIDQLKSNDILNRAYLGE